MKRAFTLLCLLLSAFGMSRMETKNPEAPLTASGKANRFMWDNLHLGNYDSIPSVLKKLNAVYEEDPKDLKTTAHLGFVYLWKFCERSRKRPDSAIVENIYLSNRFFKEAVKLNPKDPRLSGFQSAVEMCQGAVSKNFGKLLKGYINAVQAIDKWPQFNRFALSFIESQRDTASLMYKQGIKFQWQVLNECSCEDLNEKTVMDSPKKVFKALINELKNSTDPKIKRACWNSWIAPHNLEGFFLNFGDMLVKEGHLGEAEEMYKAAKLSPSFDQWVYKKIINERIDNMEKNKMIFNKPLQLIALSDETQLFINSRISCVGCHQMSKAEFKRFGFKEPTDDIYFIEH